MQSRKISLLKGITWRIIGTLDTIFLSWLFTGNISQAFKIGGIELFTKIFLFYLHERLWLISNIGKENILTDSGLIIKKDKHWRSIAKGISWRIMGTADTILIAYFITGNYTKAFEIGFTEVFTKMILYYIHERVWLKYA
ncbi:MAG TPA: DUF2061 domain-containing protein [Ignavibacteria bacterium]|nr:DUF2061 domain-containing protein [Ignavibacteria bacterium]